MHYTWMAELLRILKKEGILIFTTHGDTFAQRLLPQAKAQYDAGELVIKKHIQEGKKLFSTYHPHHFIKR